MFHGPRNVLWALLVMVSDGSMHQLPIQLLLHTENESRARLDGFWVFLLEKLAASGGWDWDLRYAWIWCSQERAQS